jgi:hypothetical protein
MLYFRMVMLQIFKVQVYRIFHFTKETVYVLSITQSSAVLGALALHLIHNNKIYSGKIYFLF